MSLVELFKVHLIPFINRKYPEYHQVYMDNAPSHTSDSSKTFILANRINQMRSPPQSPDFNPIELV
jgi:hypothetical protein